MVLINLGRSQGEKSLKSALETSVSQLTQEVDAEEKRQVYLYSKLNVSNNEQDAMTGMHLVCEMSDAMHFDFDVPNAPMPPPPLSTLWPLTASMGFGISK